VKIRIAVSIDLGISELETSIDLAFDMLFALKEQYGKQIKGF
jgi:hypothetical protein